MAEAVDAAVAPVAGQRLVADGDRGGGIAEVDLGCDAVTRPWAKPAEQPGSFVCGRYVIRFSRVTPFSRCVRTPDRVHEPVAVAQQATGRFGVRLDGGLLEPRRRVAESRMIAASAAA